MSNMLKIFGPMTLVLVGSGVYSMTVDATYQDANAIVTSFHSKCYFETVDRGVVTKTTTTSETLPCDQAEVLRLQHPKYQSMNMFGKTYVKLEYISPVDNKQYSGQLEYGYNKNGLANLKRNKRFKILAHKSNANLIRRR